MSIQILQARLERAKLAIYYGSWQTAARELFNRRLSNSLVISKDKVKWYCDTVEEVGELVLSSKDKRSPCDTTGYYVNSFYDCARWGVVKLRSSKGTLYLPVVWDESCEGVTLYPKGMERVPRGSQEYVHEQAIRDVFRYGDSCCDSYAEECREYDAKFHAEQQIETLKEEIAQELTGLATICAQRRLLLKERYFAAAKLLRELAIMAIKEVREHRERITKLEDNFWFAVEGS